MKPQLKIHVTIKKLKTLISLDFQNFEGKKAIA